MTQPVGRTPGRVRRVGLIVNPVAGIGGRVGLKGSDGAEIQQQARSLGARPLAQARALEALAELIPLQARLDLITCPGEMGAAVARTCGFEPSLLGQIEPGETSAEDTRVAARALQALGADLILFAGGDGTARDVYAAVGNHLPVLGIPAGVKIHSAVFGVNPRAAGQLAAYFLRGESCPVTEAEVMDLDEEAFRQGHVASRLFGYLLIPCSHLVQDRKAPTPSGEQAVLRGIARAVESHMEPGCQYILGPGTTTRAIAERLGVSKTLVGVDVILNRELVASDVNEARLLDLARGRRSQIVLTPIGGQGFLLGRGNQQLSPAVIQAVGRENLLVVSVPAKLNALRGRPLLVDTGDAALDARLQGYVRIITGERESIVYRVSAGRDENSDCSFSATA